MQSFQKEFNASFDKEQTNLWEKQLAALLAPEDNSYLDKQEQSFEQMLFDESFFSFKGFQSNCPLAQGLQRPLLDKQKVFSKKVTQMRVNILKNLDISSEVMSDVPNSVDARDQQLLGSVLQK